MRVTGHFGLIKKKDCRDAGLVIGCVYSILHEQWAKSRVPRGQKWKKSEMSIFKIYGTHPSFSIFSVNNTGGTLIFGMDVEIGCALKNK